MDLVHLKFAFHILNKLKENYKQSRNLSVYNEILIILVFQVDPVSQGAFGAIFAQTISNKKKIFVGSILGCIAGLAPDLDIFIRSSLDPLLKLEYHRQFTHSLIFIPIGALLVTVFTFLFSRKYLSWKEAYLYCFIGY